MGNPKQGMHYDDVKKRIKRIASTDNGSDAQKTNLVNSLVNQVRAHDGEGGVKELTQEMRGMKVQKHWGCKTRGNYSVGVCIRDCENKGTEKCDDCFKFSELVVPKKNKEDSESSCKDSE